MKDNNENNIDETLDNVNESTQEVETDALDGDGITEEEVDDTEVSEDDDDSDETHVTRFPADDNKSLGDKLASLSKKQIGCIAVLAVVIIAVIVAIIVLATSGKKKGPAVSTKPSATAVSKATEATSEQTTTTPVVKAEKDVSLEELQQTNEDVYAYIYIPGTEIEYPILQSESKGENYYLNYTIESNGLAR